MIWKKRKKEPAREIDWSQVFIDLTGQNGADNAVRTADIIGKYAGDAQVGKLRELTEYPNWWVSEIAAEKLCEISGIRDLRTLLSALNHGFELGHDCDGLQASLGTLLLDNKVQAKEILVDMLESEKFPDNEIVEWALEYVR